MDEPLAAPDAFDAWLAARRLSPELFQVQHPELYQSWKGLFNQMHPESFAAQVRFQINALRRSLQGLPALHTPPSPVSEA